MKKKILLIANEGQEGGAANALKILAEGLKDDYQPIVLMERPGPLSRFCEENKIDFRIIKFSPFRTVAGPSKLKKYFKMLLFPLYFLRYYFTNMAALRRINKIFDMSDISLIHTNTNRDDFGAMLAKKFNIPHVWHIREVDNVPYKCFSFRPRRFNYINDNATKLIMISEFVAEAYAKEGLDRDKMQVVYDGIKIRPDFQKTYSSQGLRMIILGAITAGKGQMTAVEAIRRLPKELQQNIHLDMFGHESEYAEQIQAKVKEYGLSEVSIHQFRDGINSTLSGYDLGLSCAVAEGFGLSTVEYMSNKLITVVTDTGASPEIVTKNSGFVYKLGDASQLSDIIVSVYNMNQKAKEKWGEQAYQRAKFFSEKEYVKGIKEIYSELIG